MKPSAPRGATRLERQLFLLFVLSALVPLGALSLVAARGGALTPLTGLRVTLPSLVVLTLGLVALLVLRLVRRRLAPLEQLREAVQRLLSRDFGAALSLRTGNEFEEIAAGFAAMTAQLRSHLGSLSTLIALDRAILASSDATGIADCVLERIGDLYPCDAAAVTLVDAYASERLRTFLVLDGVREGERIHAPGFGPAELRELQANPEHLVADVAEKGPRYLGPLAGVGMRRCVVLPLFVAGKLAGVIALGHRDLAAPDRERIVYARQVADQISLALSNVLAVERNRSLASYDSLTHLPTRRMYRDELEGALVHARRRNKLLAVCFVDLDGFQALNDRLGHAAGDELLCQVAGRLRESLRRSDTVARSERTKSEELISRLGGDEFTYLLRELTSPEDAAKVARRVLKAIRRPLGLEGQQVSVTASIGIAIFPQDGEDAETLLRNADAALHAARSAGRDGWKFYRESLNLAQAGKIELEGRLRGALERGELRLHYQPIRDLATGRITGAEALPHWEDRQRGLVAAGELLAAAEGAELTGELGQWMLRTACADSRAWQVAGGEAVRVAVSLSSPELRDPDLPARLAGMLGEAGASPAQLELEIAEGVLATGDDVCQAALRELERLGVGLAVDGFDSGSLSLGYLRRLPLTRLKLDRALVAEIPDGEDARALAAAIVAMARSLGIGVVAVGAETPAQAEFLRQQGCHELQGEPWLGAEQFARVLERERGEATADLGAPPTA